MTRAIVYFAGLLTTLAATALTISAIIIPRWVTYSSDSLLGHISYSYGLHKRCSSLADGDCQPFPEKSDCNGSDRYFCSMWRTTGFLMTLSVVIGFVSIASYAIIIIGGREKRENGWKILTFILLLNSIVQCTAMSLVSYLFDNDERFFVGWHLDLSWIFTTVSWCITFVAAGLVALSAWYLPAEQGYELIPERGRR